VKERSRARAWALRLLYAWDSRGGGPLPEVLEQFVARRTIAPERRAYLRRLITAVDEDPEGLDEAVQACLTNWRLQRLSVIDRNILRIAAAEMLRMDDIPPRVSIQEAVTLAERYGTDQSPRFVNGVLDALMRRIEGA